MYISVPLKIEDGHVVVELLKELLFKLLGLFLNCFEHFTLVKSCEIGKIVSELLGNDLTKQPLSVLMNNVDLVSLTLSWDRVNLVFKVYLLGHWLLLWLLGGFARLSGLG